MHLQLNSFAAHCIDICDFLPLRMCVLGVGGGWSPTLSLCSSNLDAFNKRDTFPRAENDLLFTKVSLCWCPIHVAQASKSYFNVFTITSYGGQIASKEGLSWTKSPWRCLSKVKSRVLDSCNSQVIKSQGRPTVLTEIAGRYTWHWQPFVQTTIYWLHYTRAGSIYLSSVNSRRRGR